MLQDCTIFRSDRSDHGTHAKEAGRGGSQLEGEVSLLLNGHEGSLVQVSVLLDFIVNQVPSECLHRVVESITPHVLARLLHKVHGPVLVSVASVSQLEVLNHLNSVLENASVEEGVKSISGCAQGVNTRTVFPTVLLLGKIFYNGDPISEGNNLP